MSQPNARKMTDPVENAVAITPSDATLVSTRAVYVGTGGDLAVLMAGDTVPVTFKNVPDSTLLPICVQKVMATNTTALNILGLL